jgi:beta-barrel assembly-enhancing protease
MLYEAIALSNRYPGGRKAGTIVLDNGRIIFRTEGNDITWFLTDIEFSVGGAGNQLVFIKHRIQKDITFYTHTKKILKDPTLQSSLDSLKNIQKVKTHFHIQWLIWILVILLILSPFIILFTYRTEIVKKIASKVPVSFEQKAGDQLFSLLSKNYEIITDSSLNSQFNQIVQPLVKVVSDSNFKFSVYIISDTTVNAFALPGGKVVVNSGLILKSDNWSEVQGVLAHEIAHVTQRHHIRGVINNQGFFFVLSSFFGGYSGLIDIVTSYGGKLESLMYSRKFEFEADNNGFLYLQKADINPHGMITFFQKLMEENKSEPNSGFFQMLSTHPATAERIKNLKRLENELAPKKYPKYTIDIQQFQKNLKTKLKEK